MNRKKIVIALAAAAVAGLALFALLRGRGDGKELKLYGNVDIREVELSFRVPGRVAKVNVDEGDTVKAGDVLATLDAQRYRDALAKAVGDRDVAAANMAKFQAGYRSEEVAQARAQVEQFAAQVENAARIARRREELLKSGAISAQERDDAVAQRDSLLAQLQSARKGLQLQASGFRAEDVRGAEASMRAAEAGVAAAMTDLADTEIIAPSDGRVLSRVREPGSMASAGATVLVLSLHRPVWVRAYVSEPSLGKVHLGMPVLVYTDSRPNKPYAGTVGFISPVAEFTPKNVETEALRTDLVYRLRIVVEDPDEGIRQGMPVTVKAAPAGTPDRPVPSQEPAAAPAANATAGATAGATANVAASAAASAAGNSTVPAPAKATSRTVSKAAPSATTSAATGAATSAATNATTSAPASAPAPAAGAKEAR
ncbi:MAG: secretion protein HlyD [Desulfovibrio sp.]|jgi:HlyD family secretion protein|nr:secretion protein HlyD [Desulfovibrio sp.]